MVVVVGGGEAGRRRCGGARGIAHERPAARRASFAARAKRPRRSREEAKGRQKIRARRGNMDLFGSQIQGDLIGASQWRIYQGVAKEFGSATSDSFP